MSHPTSRTQLRGQISGIGLLIGCIGCVIITASSVYTALKLGSLPWPTIFTSVTALVLLRAAGHTDIGEANVTQVIMSAGSMVAGGLAFTIPGIWILGIPEGVSWEQMLGVALAGTLLGLVCTALIRRRFVEESDLEYPIGQAAATTLLASRSKGPTARRLGISMICAGLWAVLRDGLHLIPSLLGPAPLPGVALAFQCSPMRLAVGFLVSRRAMFYWLAGGVLGWIGLVFGGSTLELWDITSAQGIASSLGMGLMMGSGVGVVIKDVVLPLVQGVRRTQDTAKPTAGLPGGLARFDAGGLGLMAAAAALVLAIVLRLSPVVCIVVVALTFVCAAMSAQSVGQSGIDPMEIFGLMVLLAVAGFAGITQIQLFFVAGTVAVACGLAGDVMSDFKTAQLVGSNPRAMWIAQALGSLLGAFVAVAVLATLVGAYGTQAFGTNALFVSAQANVVATMVAGVPSVAGFGIGLVAGVVLYLLDIPAMMVGLGVYLPFYMTLTTVAGCAVRWIYERIGAMRKVDPEAAAEAGTVVASGLLGGESIVGVVMALGTVLYGLTG